MEHKNKINTAIFFTLISLLIISDGENIVNKVKSIYKLRESLRIEMLKNEELQFKLDSTIIAQKEVRFMYVYNRFKHYNRGIDEKTVEKFIEVVEYFKLDSTKRVFDLCISQICVESGSNHKNIDGNVLESSGNAIGIAQITPTTAYHYLKNVAGEENKEIFKDLGATNYNFLLDSEELDEKTRQKVIKWCKNETNNLVLWGFIMKNILKKNDNKIIKTLVVYNIGNAGLSEYIKCGNSINEHLYVVMIMETKNLFKEILG